MTTVFLIGECNDTGLESLVKSNLTNTYSVTYIKDSAVSRCGKGYDILVMDTPHLGIIELSECIVVMKDYGEVPSVKLPEKSIVIANSENTQQLERLEAFKQRVITCGKGGRDTFSYTSLTYDGIVISLNREITAFSGKKVQPLEIPVKFTVMPDNVYDTIAYTALRLVLDDYDSEIGLLY
ncbi:MAG: hypothetical protein LBC82_00730 [Oscillospiraceae bacterium]|jgi:hypothetical protein|nr:hypothetical protein [Oscillospiraceae bacterium]